MKVSPRAQREFRPSHAEKFAADFDLEALGYPVVNHRDGHYFVVDGQHRIEALKMIGWGDQQIQCECYEGMTEAQEADLFLRRDDRRAIRSFDKFRIAVTAEREAETDIERVVLAQGLKISNSDSPGCLSAIAALQKVYKTAGPEGLGRALRIVRDAYGGHQAALRGDIITGLGLVCSRYNGKMDDEKAVERLSKVPGGALGLMGKAEVIRRQTGRQKAHCVAAATVETYNAGRGGSKLEPWWK
jgi:hypothetical protein